MATNLKRIATLLCLLCACVAGCGPKVEMTDQQTADQRQSMKEWAAWGAKVAEDHGLAYHLSIDLRGIGSVGQRLDFYADTGIGARMTLFGNAALGRDQKDDPLAESTEVKPPGESVGKTESTGEKPPGEAVSPANTDGILVPALDPDQTYRVVLQRDDEAWLHTFNGLELISVEPVEP